MKSADHRISRRDAIGLLGAVAGASIVSKFGSTANPLGAAALQRGRDASAVSFPRGAIIRTLLRDVSPEALAGGSTLFHQHLHGMNTLSPAYRYQDDVDLMIQEVGAAAKEGISCIVDGGHVDMGRRLDVLRRIAIDAGMPIVASGGYYTQRTYPQEIARKTVEQIADDLVGEATRDRLGAFGEIGQAGGELTPDERKVFQAVGKAHLRTGLPIFTHNAYTGNRTGSPAVPREAGLRQLDVLESVGVEPHHVAIGHMCCLQDPAGDVAQQIAKRGAFVGFDRVTLETNLPDSDRVVMLMALVDAGCADNVLLSSDGIQEQTLKKNGGAGLASVATVFAPKLLEAGLPEATLRHILVDNPRRFLAFIPTA